MAQRGRPSRPTRPREDRAQAVVQLLAQARRATGMTRTRLSAVSGISMHTIAKIEQAAVTDPGFTVVATLAEALGLSLDDLASQSRDTRRTAGVAPRQQPESRT